MAKKKDLLDPVARHDHIQGGEHATLTLVEYGDFQCPYCVAAYPMIKQIQEELGSSLRFVFRNFPLTDVHPNAEGAAEAAEAAGAQGKFWEMHDALFEMEGEVGPRDIAPLAGEIGLDQARFERDLESGRFQHRVHDDFMLGVRSGVNGTPGFFINGERYAGPWQDGTLLGVLLEVLRERRAG